MSVQSGAVETAATDVLVFGGGIAGHRAAMAARRRGEAISLAFVAKGASIFVIGCNAPSDMQAHANQKRSQIGKLVD